MLLIFHKTRKNLEDFRRGRETRPVPGFQPPWNPLDKFETFSVWPKKAVFKFFSKFRKPKNREKSKTAPKPLHEKRKK